MFNRRKESTKITIETHEVTRIRLRHTAVRLRYCPICRQGVSGLSRAQSTEVFRADDVVLDELFESKKIHALEDGEICGNSLVTYFR